MVRTVSEIREAHVQIAPSYLSHPHNPLSLYSLTCLHGRFPANQFTIFQPTHTHWHTHVRTHTNTHIHTHTHSLTHFPRTHVRTHTHTHTHTHSLTHSLTHFPRTYMSAQWHVVSYCAATQTNSENGSNLTTRNVQFPDCQQRWPH